MSRTARTSGNRRPALAVVACLLAVACGGAPTPGPAPQPAPADEPLTNMSEVDFIKPYILGNPLED